METIAGPEAIRVNTRRGKRLPLHRTALGRTLASDLPAAKLAAMIANTGPPASTPNTHQTLEAPQADLEVTHQRGLLQARPLAQNQVWLRLLRC